MTLEKRRKILALMIDATIKIEEELEKLPNYTKDCTCAHPESYYAGEVPEYTTTICIICGGNTQ